MRVERQARGRGAPCWSNRTLMSRSAEGDASEAALIPHPASDAAQARVCRLSIMTPASLWSICRGSSGRWRLTGCRGRSPVLPPCFPTWYCYISNVVGMIEQSSFSLEFYTVFWPCIVILGKIFTEVKRLQEHDIDIWQDWKCICQSQLLFLK